MSTENGPVTSIAIFGKGDVLWPVATLLEKALPDRIALTLVEDAAQTERPGAATLACDNPFFEAIRLKARDLVAHASTMLGLGTDCRGWQGESSSFFAAPSGTLPAINNIALHHIMLRAAMMHEGPERLAHLFQPFRFAARVALAGKFADRSEDINSPLRMLGPTVQIDRGALGTLLKEKFPDGRAHCHHGTPKNITMDVDGHALRTIKIGNGQEIAADLFIDVSGAVSRLVPGGEQLRTQSLADILPFDRVIRRFDAGMETRDHLHTVACAMPGGITVETPLQDGVVSETLFSSTAMEDNRPSSSFEPGICENPWTGNLVRLGTTATQLGPYQSADMMLLLEQAQHLVRAIPANRDMDIEATEFNRNQFGSARQIRDFAILPFVLNGRGEALWTGIRSAARPEQLKLRLDQFKSRGRFIEFDHEIFEQQSWIEMMIGFGIVPERYDPSAEFLDMKRLAPILKTMVDGFAQAIEVMPDHTDYVAAQWASK